MNYNHCRPNGNLDYMSPTAFTAMRLEQSCGTFCLIQDREIKRKTIAQQPAQETVGRPRAP